MTQLDVHSNDGDRTDRIAGLLHEARKSAGLSQSALARASSISQPNISDYESGKRSPTVRTLVALLDACGYDISIAPKTVVD